SRAPTQAHANGLKGARIMSTLGQQRTLRPLRSMSALALKETFSGTRGMPALGQQRTLDARATSGADSSDRRPQQCRLQTRDADGYMSAFGSKRASVAPSPMFALIDDENEKWSGNPVRAPEKRKRLSPKATEARLV